MLSKTAQGIVGGEENEQMGVGQECARFDVEKEYDGEEDDVIWPHRPKKWHGENVDAGEDGRQAAKGHTSNDLVPRVERTDQPGHGCCITATGDRSEKMVSSHQSHSSADSAT